MIRTACTAMIIAAGAASAQTVYTETFDTGNAGWQDGPGNPALDGGGYLTTTVDLSTFSAPPFGGGPTTGLLFRGEADDNASGGAFVGDYIGNGIDEILIDVRHDAQGPLAFALRIATPANSPAVIASSPVAVAGGSEFTTVSFSLEPSSQFLQFAGFGGTIESVLSDVGNIQVLGVLLDGGPDSGAVNFDLDNVRIVPAPASGVLLGLGGLVAARRRR